jgi:ankyrin repeat protein
LEAGSDINAQDNQGNSALIVATKFSTRQTAPSTLKLLVEAGANLNLCDNKGLSAIDWCCKTLKPETEQNLLLLLEAGAKLKKNRPYLSQILKSTECNVSLTLIKKLIKAGVDVNIFLPGELTSLMLCVEYSKLEILILLLSIPEIDVSIQGGTQELTAYEMALNKYGPDSSITLLLLTYENRGKKRDYRQTLFSSDIL